MGVSDTRRAGAIRPLRRRRGRKKKEEEEEEEEKKKKKRARRQMNTMMDGAFPSSPPGCLGARA